MNYYKSLIKILFISLLFGISSSTYASGHGGGDEKEIDPNAPVVPVIAYYELEPKFITNLSSTGNKLSYVKVKVTLMINDSRELPLIKEHEPAIRDTVVSILGAATVDELKNPQGREKLQEKTKEELTQLTDKYIGRRVLKKVMFTDFLVQ